jgi:hypothetical protein
MRLRTLLFLSFTPLPLALACGGTTVVGTGAGTTTGTTGTGGGVTPSGCPASASPGTACATAGATCTYGDSILPDCREVVTCTGGVWNASHNACGPPSPACPPSAPTGQPLCDVDAGAYECGYPDGQICVCSQCPPQGGVCMEQPPAWYCGSPSGPAGCPAIIPNEGSACSGTLTCNYPSGCGIQATCTAGAWAWMQFGCGG